MAQKIQNDRMKLIDKIVKLLALSEGTNHTEEADTARQKAAELMAKHNLTYSELESKTQGFIQTERIQTTKSPEKFDMVLINVIAKFNGVCFLTRVTDYAKARFIYIGTEQDIEACEYMVDMVKAQRKVAYDIYSKEYIAKYGKAAWEKDWTDWRRWMNGFFHGVKAKLNEITNMSNAKVQEWGIVPIDPSKLALNWYHENVGGTRSTKGRKMDISTSGYNAGKNVSLNKGIASNNGTKQIC